MGLLRLKPLPGITLLPCPVGQLHSSPSHISKTVLSIVKIGPPTRDKIENLHAAVCSEAVSFLSGAPLRCSRLPRIGMEEMDQRSPK